MELYELEFGIELLLKFDIESLLKSLKALLLSEILYEFELYPSMHSSQIRIFYLFLFHYFQIHYKCILINYL